MEMDEPRYPTRYEVGRWLFAICSMQQGVGRITQLKLGEIVGVEIDRDDFVGGRWRKSGTYGILWEGVAS